jgi:hypothetical protein
MYRILKGDSPANLPVQESTKGDEAFMFGRRENAVGVVDSDALIQGRVENEQRLLQTGYSFDQALRPARSSRNSRRIRNDRPASTTSASPRALISGMRSLKRPIVWAGSAGPAMVTTARASGTSAAAASTAAPPRLCPMRSAGARWSAAGGQRR